MRSLYQAEVERLAEEFRPRILAGEFSGREDEGRGGPAHCNLGRELAKSHPLCADMALENLVVAGSTWPETAADLEERTGITYGEQYAYCCLEHDVMEVAVRRGWVKPLREGLKGLDEEPYALRVA